MPQLIKSLYTYLGLPLKTEKLKGQRWCKEVLLKNCCRLSWPVRYGANYEHVEVQCDNAAAVDIVKAKTSKHKDITV